MKKILIFMMMACMPISVVAQAAGGQITRKQTTTTTQPNNTNKQKQNVQNRLSQQRRAAQLQAERERKERLEQERAERERIAKAQAERERQERETQEQAAKEAERTRILQNLINNMVFVEGGTFKMGAKGKVPLNEKPAHQVTLTSFSIGRYEVTQEEWQAVIGSNPSYFKGAKRPVESVSWNDCQEFIRKLNAMTGKHFRLPTEAEWEYAARGGNRSRGYKYAGSNDLNSVAWYEDNSGNQTHEVGSKQPNELGLYDMSGNVREWCQDWYDSKYYSSSPQSNPQGPSSGTYYRVIRGGGIRDGGILDYAKGCRVSYRSTSTPDYRVNGIGFRLAQ